ncbi:MAG: hypothetical protein V7606_36 [Burkholderiales bacterium]|jgi:hypothetical protein
MTSRTLHRRGRKGRANARPFRNIETTDIETIAITDEVAQSLIDTFPASDPPAWIPLARVGIPNRQKTSRPAPKERHR